MYGQGTKKSKGKGSMFYEDITERYEMLKYDEWVVPGEVEYAGKKAAEIETLLRKYYECFVKDSLGLANFPLYIQITEHIIGKFKVTLPESVWNPAADTVVRNDMMLDWFQDVVAPIDGPKVFDFPTDDIRSNLPEWDESFLPDEILIYIMREHSVQYMAAMEIENMEGDYGVIKRKFGFSDVKCGRIMEDFVKKLDTQNKPVQFTEREEKIADYLKYHGYYLDSCGGFYEPWLFPLTMSERDIIDVIHEAYLNAGKKSRRRIPEEFDYINIDKWRFNGCPFIENYECLYQGRVGDMTVRFVFDYKNQRIVTAYPVLKEKRLLKTHMCYGYYDKEFKCFAWRF